MSIHLGQMRTGPQQRLVSPKGVFSFHFCHLMEFGFCLGTAAFGLFGWGLKVMNLAALTVSGEHKTTELS